MVVFVLHMAKPDLISGTLYGPWVHKEWSLSAKYKKTLNITEVTHQKFFLKRHLLHNGEIYTFQGQQIFESAFEFSLSHILKLLGKKEENIKVSKEENKFPLKIIIINCTGEIVRGKTFSC